jgi:hypothetical protein
VSVTGTPSSAPSPALSSGPSPAPASRPPRTPGRPVLLLAAVLALAVPAISASGSDFPGRPLLALAYVVAVPGVAVAGLLRLPSRLACLVLAVAVSLGALLLLATVQLTAGLWSPITTQVVLSCVAVVATTAEMLRVERPGHEPGAADGEPA